MKKSDKKANLLIHESSPYLLQHAYNPVAWHPWNNDTLEKAKELDKPILVSIGYSTCHWCHVMERESFEDPIVADYMNEHFINIKVDREERPDIDAIYMEAVQLIQNGQGGWPLNCFLTPDGRPFFGGTYFPPKNAYRRTSWTEVIHNLNLAFRHRRDEIEGQADKITAHISKAQAHFVQDIAIDSTSSAWQQADINTLYNKLSQSFDRTHGGFGSAPKFPATMALRFCLNYYLSEKHQGALEQLNCSLKSMINGGIYDHLGGGFSRYAVDEKWLVPHFEKMLYDNALLIGLMADSYKIEANESYRQCIAETFEWLQREMTAPSGGFYAALDADSEGVEGKFYIWSKAEIDAKLGKDAAIFCAFYDVTEDGNWENSNILHQQHDFLSFCENYQLDPSKLRKQFNHSKALLLDLRETRIRPGLDDKILLDWNAMMITALLKASQALSDERYKRCALQSLNFLTKALKVEGTSLELYHSYKDGVGKYTAFLDDYALLIEALLEAYQCSQSQQYLQLAERYTEYVNNHFLDQKDGLYFFTSAKQTDVLLHKKSIYDSATPSGNAVMLHNLQKLSFLLDNNRYHEQGLKMLAVLQKTLLKYPQSFGYWAAALFREVYPLKSIRIKAADWSIYANPVLKNIFFDTFVFYEAQEASQKDSFLVCIDQQCHLPVHQLTEALNLL